MRRKILLSSSMLFVAALAMTWPSTAHAQGRGRGGGGRVVVAASPVFYSPFYDPFFYGYGYGPWGWGPGPWGYPYGGYRWSNEASLRIDVKPRDAQVYVDGYYAGVVDQFDGKLQRLHVPPGTHEITVYKEGYRSVHERLYLAPNSSRKLTHDLDRLAAGEPNEPLPQPIAQPNGPGGPGGPGRPGGPDGPGGYNGPGPDDRDTPPPPPPARRRAPDPRDGRGPDPRDQARRAPRNAGNVGTVAIRVQPGDAEIFIDGERWAGGGDDERLIVQLSEGTHHVEVQKDGYRRVSLDVRVRRGETAPVNVALSRD